MQKKWNDGLQPLTSKLDIFKQMLKGLVRKSIDCNTNFDFSKDGASSNTIQSDLFNLLMNGVGSPTVQQFLTNTIPESVSLLFVTPLSNIFFGSHFEN